MVPSEEEQKAQEILDKLPEEARKRLVIDNEGKLVAKNRAYRRQKPPADNWFTKKTHRIQKIRKKINVQKAKYDRRLARAGKSSSKSNSQSV